MTKNDKLEAPRASGEHMGKLVEMMEEMAGTDKKEHGKRQPGEYGTYELSRMKENGWEFNTDTQIWESPEVIAKRARGEL